MSGFGIPTKSNVFSIPFSVRVHFSTYCEEKLTEPPERSKQKKSLAVTMAMYFAELGYVCNPKEFAEDPKRPPLIKIPTIKKIFGSWSLMEIYTRSFCPELMQGLTDKKPKKEVPTPKAEANPLEELQAKTASPAEDEGVDGKDI